MKELRSRKFPGRIPQILNDEDFAKLSPELKRNFIVRDVPEIKHLIPTPKLEKPVIEVKKKKKNE